MTTRLQNATQVDRSASAEPLGMSAVEQTLAFLTEAYDSQLATCNLLENMADSLPDPPHSYISQQLISMLNGHWTQQIVTEEEELFSLLERHYKQHSFVANFLNRLRIERQSDSDLASELATAFEAILQTNKVRDPEAFGYMLRGVFETKRRQIELKKAVILPLVEQLLEQNTKL